MCNIGYFTVDNTQKWVDTFKHAAIRPYEQAFGIRKFQPQDNLLIKSNALALPYCFTIADLPPYINVQYYKPSTGTYHNMTEFGTAGNLFLHSENVEIETNILFTWPQNLIGEAHTILYGAIGNPDIIGPHISMINAPAALNGDELPLYSMLKVLHTLPMIA